MNLLEHDGKELLARHGVPVPAGKLLTRTDDMDTLPAGPWLVKGQITAGGRGTAGIIKKAATQKEVAEHTQAILGSEVKGRTVESMRVEQQVAAGVREAYQGLLLAPAESGVRAIMAAEGGMAIEALPRGQIQTEVATTD